jgi:ubiquinone biosynthesis protein COQ9
VTASLTALRDAILLAALPHVPFDGWTRRAMRRGAAGIGRTASDADRAFP